MPQNPLISEADFQQTVLQMAGAHGWLRHHSFDSRKAPRDRHGQPLIDPGFPALVLMRQRKDSYLFEILFVELNAEGKVPSRAQDQWIMGLARIGSPTVRFYCWYPSDLDEIERLLSVEPPGG